MTLTLGSGVFGERSEAILHRAHGRALLLEPSPRRVRGRLDDVTVVDAARPYRLHRSGALPRFLFSWEDVRTDLLIDSEHREQDEDLGEVRFWSLRYADHVVPDAVWSWPVAQPAAPDLSRLCAISFEALDEWLEEDERIEGHPRDPYHRVDPVLSSRHVEVRLGDRVIAGSDRPVIVFETGLPPRYYLPRADVDFEKLRASDHQTHCPYKGTTSDYWDVSVDGRRLENVAWAYDEPNPGCEKLADRVAFFHPELRIEVDTPSEVRQG